MLLFSLSLSLSLTLSLQPHQQSDSCHFFTLFLHIYYRVILIFNTIVTLSNNQSIYCNSYNTAAHSKLRGSNWIIPSSGSPRKFSRPRRLIVPKCVNGSSHNYCKLPGKPNDFPLTYQPLDYSRFIPSR
jgi:hypothetical protein